MQHWLPVDDHFLSFYQHYQFQQTFVEGTKEDRLQDFLAISNTE